MNAPKDFRALADESAARVAELLNAAIAHHVSEDLILRDVHHRELLAALREGFDRIVEAIDAAAPPNYGN